MPPIRACPLPHQALLTKYASAGAYTDCYAVDVAQTVSHAQYVEAFYSGALFRIERLLLRLFLSKPSTDADVRLLAAGEATRFAAWRVEDRAADQILMCDLAGRTRSWLMVAPALAGSKPSTRLYFGSAVVPMARAPGASGRPRMGFAFSALLGFHKLYSRALLASARSRLARSGR